MSKVVTGVIVVVGLALLGFALYLIISDNKHKHTTVPTTTLAQSDAAVAAMLAARAPVPSEEVCNGLPVKLEGFTTDNATTGAYASEANGMNEMPQSVGHNMNNVSMGMSQLPSECYPKDVLSSADLLPRDANSLYAQVNPSSQGSLQDQNYLSAGFHVGIDTVGQTLRNANRQLRSEPPNPQVQVSPWSNTTIESDINRRPLEIGGCY